MANYNHAIGTIANRAFNRRLSLFLGTSFSKSLVEFIPTFRELYEQMCIRLQIDEKQLKLDPKIYPRTAFKMSLLPFYKDFPEYNKDDHYFENCKFHVKRAVSTYIQEVTPTPNKVTLLPSYKESLCIINPQVVFTTNYDDVTKYPFDNPKTITSYSRYDNAIGGTRIIYLHGHADSPESLVLFDEDLLKFNDEDKYLQHLLYVSFVENVTLFIGYRLNDHNIMQILDNITRKERKGCYSNRYLFVEKDEYPKYMIDHYERTYQVEIIEGESINQLLNDIANAVKKIQEWKGNADNFEKFFIDLRDKNQVDVFIQDEELFIEMLEFLNDHKKYRIMESFQFIINILDGIKLASHESKAFTEYKHLARYLILIGSKWGDISSNTYFANEFVDYFNYVLRYAGDLLGDSWAAARLLREEFNSQQKVNISFLRKNPQIEAKLQDLKIIS